MQESAALSTIRKLIEGYGVDDVSKQIESAIAQQEKIRKPIAWLVSAVKGNYEVVNDDTPPELTPAADMIEHLRYCVRFPNRTKEIYPTLLALSKETGRPLEEVYAENDYLLAPLDEYRQIAQRVGLAQDRS